MNSEIFLQYFIGPFDYFSDRDRRPGSRDPFFPAQSSSPPPLTPFFHEPPNESGGGAIAVYCALHSMHEYFYAFSPLRRGDRDRTEILTT